MNKKIWLSSPHMEGSELELVKDAFESNWIAPLGPHVDGFEQELANYTGTRHAAALSAGTAALHLALILSGVQPGDEVICQSFTFSASANPIVYVGATPVFIDSERDTWNMDPTLLETAIKERLAKGKKIGAIIPVHLYGMPAKMEEIMAIAKKYEIPVIEDAAEALGSKLHGKACGSFGNFGVLSFNGNKIITTSGGGALLGNDGELISKARFLASQARDAAPHYQHSQIGYNYRMSNIVAAIGRGQMTVIDARVAERRKNFEYYYKELSGLPGISFQEAPEGYFSNRWLTTILVDPAEAGGLTRETIRLALEKENIESRPLWKPMHLQPVFANHPAYVNGVGEELFDKGLCLPSGSNLSEADLAKVVSVIKSNTA
ncbi:DegT/DnrJ/EryC1/StrS aminotransferase family protein [Chitinophaga terrae (ex Kim and Jung 2007)]|uniref:GDP-perosamine synthase n=1 Tax=Chitinophaga terrae (ex Kim and Jung 2007) TaxID=408074 RepID=A0A1H4AMQ6_9BACT|nr:aminotransferase class I/II-fold pyridoxal phosphate-dependent enzyme [Chitinophaga terrae (ex Kim and Jung 2007)]MDQ0106644.1 dTDP-4-amino-4,6-dideoxygalactose transaminase [Chitinophaga terrae (ex Kim and Jung 2007)]GEP89258.1 pyridoxal phosphate-dependent aminotransferase [Chitinophaga terrae (ex Kim and Jung 2007)]SEA36992.1 DegT/DnrJ/EryC1/StrS aminotransferase family protein [Chitinophaga terrae (ex Kim and Jung 2007)]